MASDNGGPWGGGGGNGDGDDRRGQNGGKRPPQSQITEIDRIVRKGQEQLRVLMGGRGGRGGGGGSGGFGFRFTRGTAGFAALILIVIWGLASFYSVKPEEQSVELFLGKHSQTGNPGLNFAPWPIVTAEVIAVTREQTEDIGVSTSGAFADRADADDGRKHRRHRFSGGLEHLGSGQIFV